MHAPIRLSTFGDYGPDFGWFAYCGGCNRQRAFGRDEIARRFGLEAEVDRIRLRLRCSGCGRRSGLLYRYYRGGMHGPSATAYGAPPRLPET